MSAHLDHPESVTVTLPVEWLENLLGNVAAVTGGRNQASAQIGYFLLVEFAVTDAKREAERKHNEWLNGTPAVREALTALHTAHYNKGSR